MEKIRDIFGLGAHRAFFGILIKNKFSLITKDESELSSAITKEEADSFLRLEIDKP